MELVLDKQLMGQAIPVRLPVETESNSDQMVQKVEATEYRETGRINVGASDRWHTGVEIWYYESIRNNKVRIAAFQIFFTQYPFFLGSLNVD